MNEVKTVSEFVELVEKMRRFQDEWYKTNSMSSRLQAQNYEKQVDKAIQDRKARGLPKQPELPA